MKLSKRTASILGGTAMIAILALGFAPSFGYIGGSGSGYWKTTTTTQSSISVCGGIPPLYCTVTVTVTSTGAAPLAVPGSPFVEIDFHNGTTTYCAIPLETTGNQTWMDSIPGSIASLMTSAGEAATSCSVTHIPGTP